MPKVSIIMNCYNSDKFLKEAIDSVYAQTYNDWEIIFWDNQSTDNSAGIAKSYDERLKYFYADEFSPLSAARNKALEKAQGEYIAFLDSDDEWLPEKLEKQVNVFEEQPDVDFIYSNFFVVNTLKKTSEAAHRDLQPGGNIFIKQLSFSYSLGILTVMFKSELLSKTSEWFDANLNIPADFEFFLRLLRFSTAYYIEEPLAIYRVHNSSVTRTQFDGYYNDLRYVEQKLSALYGSDNDDISNALQAFARDIDLNEARKCLLNGGSKKAAELFGKHDDLSKKEKLLFMLSKLPGKAAKVIYNSYIGMRGVR